MKRIISVVLFLMFVFSNATSVMAEAPGADIPMPLYTGIATCYCDLNSNGNQLTITGGITVWDGYNSKLTIQLQERNGYSGSWYTKTTYVSTGSDTRICSVNDTFTATPGHSYRGYCIFQAFDSNGNKVDEDRAYTTILFM